MFKFLVFYDELVCHYTRTFLNYIASLNIPQTREIVSKIQKKCNLNVKEQHRNLKIFLNNTNARIWLGQTFKFNKKGKN